MNDLSFSLIFSETQTCKLTHVHMKVLINTVVPWVLLKPSLLSLSLFHDGSLGHITLCLFVFLFASFLLSSTSNCNIDARKICTSLDPIGNSHDLMGVNRFHLDFPIC
jgi:hypothetical protein